jgi:hypothetical protein
VRGAAGKAPPGPPASAARNRQNRSSSAPVRLTVHDGTSCHTVYLDELTHTLAVAWLHERQERWPGTTIPYLLVSQQTVVDPNHPPVTPTPNASPSRPDRHSRLREPQNPGRMQRSHTWRRCQAEC